MIRALVIFAVLVVVASAATWALAAYTRRLDGTGTASQASGSPDSILVVEPASVPLGYEVTAEQVHRAFDPPPCGAQGPGGMSCDQPTHDGVRHAEGDLTWIDGGGPVPRPPAPRPTDLGNAPAPKAPARGEATP